MIGIEIAPPWRKHGTYDDIEVFEHPDGRFAVGVEKKLKTILRDHGARGHIIVSWHPTCDYIEGPSVQSVLDRTLIVRRAMETLGYKAEVQRVIDELTAPAVKRITRTRRA